MSRRIVASTQRNATTLASPDRSAADRIRRIFGAFNIARPLRALVVPLQRMAKGEAVELPGTERQDEIGETACAVNDIKVMLAEKARREAEAKIEQDKRAEAERQAAMQKMADEFEAAVGGIVQAAVAGDFSQRVRRTSGQHLGFECQARNRRRSRRATIEGAPRAAEADRYRAHAAGRGASRGGARWRDRRCATANGARRRQCREHRCFCAA